VYCMNICIPLMFIEQYCWHCADFTLNNNQTFQRFISKGTKTNLCSSFGVRFMVFNATFNNSSVISWLSVLLVEETGTHQKCWRIQLTQHHRLKKIFGANKKRFKLKFRTMISVFENKWHTRTTDQRGTRGHRGRDRMVVGFTRNENKFVFLFWG
jgi:hypothetical protein